MRRRRRQCGAKLSRSEVGVRARGEQELQDSSAVVGFLPRRRVEGSASPPGHLVNVDAGQGEEIGNGGGTTSAGRGLEGGSDDGEGARLVGPISETWHDGAEWSNWVTSTCSRSAEIAKRVPG